MSTIVDRYIDVAINHVPGKARRNAERDMRSMIDELIEGRIAQGETPDLATTNTLNELGDPRELAHTYDEQQNYLIGPRYYYQYVDLLRTLLSWIPGMVFAVLFVVNILEADGGWFEDVIGAAVEALVAALFAAFQVFFWVTLSFAVWERTGPHETTIGGFPLPKPGASWTVADLPKEPARRQISVSDSVFGFGLTALVGILLYLQHQRGVEVFVWGAARDAVDIAAKDVPLFNPNIPTAMVYLTFGVIALSALMEIVKYIVGYWTLPVTIVDSLLSFLWTVIPLVIAVQWGIVNDAVTEVLNEDVAEFLTSNTFEQLLVVGFALVSAINVWEALKGHLQYRRRTRRI